jgi:hypothetical protein
VSTKLTVAFAALALSIAASPIARGESESDAASSQATQAPKKDKQKKHPPLSELDKLERGNPASVYYKSRKKSTPSPTNAQVDSAESGVPASTDYANRPRSSHNPTNAEINAAETGNPESVDYRKTPQEVLQDN